MTELIKFKKSNCKNCHKCIRNCPVKSIRFTGSQANVITDECILCGRCYVVCPQNAKQIVDETEILRVLINESSPVVASVAPSFAAYFDGIGFESLKKALIKLGFDDAEETAVGATLVKREYERIVEKNEEDIVITSCCHTVNLLVEKYYPQLTVYLAPVMTPMKAHAADIRRRKPDSKVVFIGPCLSKKDEAQRDRIEAAITFDELSSMLKLAGITPEHVPDENPESRARLFPTSGGILETMLVKNPAYTYVSVDGIDNCRSVLNDIAEGNVHNMFIEMSACSGSCIGGPIMEKNRNNPLRHYKAVVAGAGKKDFNVNQPDSAELRDEYKTDMIDKAVPTDEQIKEILKKMDKCNPCDELNCGSCGYNTCREKAVAIYQGKAEINMCLPYLMEKAERLSGTILDNTPNGILVLNEAMEVQQINPAAMNMLHIASSSDILGEPVMRILDPDDFYSALRKNERIVNKRGYYSDYKKYLELTIACDRVSGNLIAIFRDVTDEEKARASKEELRRKTVDTTDKVIDKQMRIVQEIASLLGETTAETKIALTKLKESMVNDE